MLRSRPSHAALACLLGASLFAATASADSAAAPEGEEVELGAVSEPEAVGDLETAVADCDPIFDDDCEDEEYGSLAHFPDPWERYNRGALGFNRGVDKWVFDPITRVYQLLPDPVEAAILRAVENLECPAIAINDGLQLEWVDMGVTMSRLVINSTFGLAGLFDPASAWGLEHHDSDFGQTLTLAGLPSGPYMILPLVGPTTVRDGSGAIADAAMSPLLYVFGLASFETLYRAGSSGLAVRADKIQELHSLEKGSIDFYAALRSAYYQNRQAQIWSRREHRRADAISIGLPVAHGSPAEHGEPEAAH